MLNRSPIDGFLRVDNCGQIHVIGPSLRQRLANETGRFRFSGSEQGTLTFAKAPELKAIRELDSEILLSGSIDRLSSLADIINLIAIARYDTHLVVIGSHHRHTVSFQKGRIRSAHSTDPANRLGEIIHRQGHLPRDTVDRCLVEARSARRPIGNYLVELNLITESALMESIERQVHVIFRFIASQKSGDFFLTTLNEETYQPHVDLDAQRELLEALTASDEIAHFERRLDEHHRIRRTADPEEEPINMTRPLRPLDRLLLTLLSEPIGALEFLQRHSARKVDTLEALIRLETSGHIELIQINEPKPEPAVIPLAEPLKLSQSQALLGRVNESFKRLYQAAKRRNERSPLDGALNTFLQFYGYKELFDGVTHNQAGLLDEQRVLENLAHIETEQPRSEYLERALHELLHFALYASKDFLDRRELREMQHALTVLFSPSTQKQGSP